MKNLIFLITIAGILILGGCTKNEKHIKRVQIIQDEPIYILEETK